MFFKVMKDNRVIDVLDKIVYLKWEPKHKIMVLTNINDAQAILSSDKNHIWHEESLYNVPVSGYDIVKLIEIDEYEYDELVRMKLMSYNDIYDSVILELIQEGLLRNSLSNL